MPLPSERITLSIDENSAIRAGLNTVLNGFAEIVVNNRRSPEILHPELRDKYQPREFHQEMYALVLDLRNRFAIYPSESSKHRLNCIQLSAAAFALRIARQKKVPVAQSRELDAKLEAYRKRAKRAALKRLGAAEYQNSQRIWNEFTNWVRFNVLPLRVPRKSLTRKLYEEQRASMTVLAKEMIGERCECPVEGKTLVRLVELAIREIRRGRHGDLKVRTLLTDPAAAREFLFIFFRKRLELQVRYEFLTWCEQAAVRSERMKAALAVAG